MAKRVSASQLLRVPGVHTLAAASEIPFGGKVLASLADPSNAEVLQGAARKNSKQLYVLYSKAIVACQKLNDALPPDVRAPTLHNNPTAYSVIPTSHTASVHINSSAPELTSQASTDIVIASGPTIPVPGLGPTSSTADFIDASWSARVRGVVEFCVKIWSLVPWPTWAKIGLLLFALLLPQLVPRVFGHFARATWTATWAEIQKFALLVYNDFVGKADEIASAVDSRISQIADPQEIQKENGAIKYVVGLLAFSIGRMIQPAAAPQ